MKKIYYIERENSLGDIFCGAYEKPEDAILAADKEWANLTAAEKAAASAITVFYGSCPAEMPLDEAMDYILDEDTGGYQLISFGLINPLTVSVNSPEAAALIDSVIPAIPMADGLVLTVEKIRED